MKTYIQQCKEKVIKLNENTFDNFVEFWHTSEQTRNMTLHEAIGITWKEYSQYILDSEELLKLLEKKLS